MDLFVLNFFVLVNSNKLVETPELLKEYEAYAYNMYKNIVDEQLYLLDAGVSFEYSDELDSMSRNDLVRFVSNWIEKHQQSKI